MKSLKDCVERGLDFLPNPTRASVRSAWLTEEEYLLYFKRKIEHLRVPLTGDLAITHRCNLRYVHCYLDSGRENASEPVRELGTKRFLKIVDEVTEAGCLFLLITGGEPLLRRDFIQIYRHARGKGLLMTVFTNGTVVTDRVLDAFEEFPPLAVEVTVYGATQETYERITGVEGSYKRCLRGIERLLDRKVAVRLKTVLMSHNRHEFFDIQEMARQYGVRFRMDAGIFPCFDGDKSPLSLRVPPEEAVEKEFSDESRLWQYQKLFERLGKASTGEQLYTCGAGLTYFHVDSRGYLYPCLMVKRVGYNLSRGDFLTGWGKMMVRIRERKASPSFPCTRCEKRVLCGFCPAFFELETGAEEVPSSYLCSLGRIRFQALQKARS